MYYEICVSRNGTHLFATAQRSITTPYEAQQAYSEIKNRFPESEGWQVKAYYYTQSGFEVSDADMRAGKWPKRG